MGDLKSKKERLEGDKKGVEGGNSRTQVALVQ